MGLPPNDPLRALPPQELHALLEDIIDSWPRWELKPGCHIELEIAAVDRGETLGPGEPVPGCNCESCTGVPPVVRAPSRRWEEKVDIARAVSLPAVLASLGLGIVKRGRAEKARCPLHDDHDPSMSIESDAGLWFCHVCAEGGDAIQLWMRARGVTFAEAVRELAA